MNRRRPIIRDRPIHREGMVVRTANGGIIQYDAQGRIVARRVSPANLGGSNVLRNPELTAGTGGVAAANARAGAPPAGGGGTAPQPAAPAAPAWVDSAFAGGVGGLASQIQAQRAGILQQGAYDAQDFAQQNVVRARQTALARENADYGANSGGNFYSGQLGKAQGIITRDSMEQQAAAQTAFNRAQAARQSALDQIGTIVADPNSPTGYAATGGAAQTLWNYVNSAQGRQLDRNQDIAPPADEPAPTGQTPAQVALSGGPAVRRMRDGREITALSKDSQGPSRAYDRARGGWWHYYKNRKPVFVKGK